VFGSVSSIRSERWRAATWEKTKEGGFRDEPVSIDNKMSKCMYVYECIYSLLINKHIHASKTK